MRPAPLPIITLFCAAMALSGCALFSDAPHYRGIVVTPHDLSELTPGISSQADAQALLGPPTFVEQFAPNEWVYVSQTTKMRIGNTEGVKKQDVVRLSFDNNGVLKSVDEKNLHTAVRVTMDGAQTPVPGGHAGFIQQLVGGVGSYNPGIGGGGVGATNGADAVGGSGGAGNIGGTNSSGGF